MMTTICYTNEVNKNIKIIFTDIDCTIYDHSIKPSRFDKVSISYLKKLQKKGIKIFFCTARPYHSVQRIHILDLIKPDGMILANGGLILYKNQIIYGPYMNVSEFEKLCELANEYTANVEGIRPYNCFLINNNVDSVKELFETYPEDIPPVEDYHNQRVIGATLFATKEIDGKIKEIFPKDFYYFRYHDHGVDVASIPHIKGEGIKFVLDYLKINKENAVAIGDDLQDITMYPEVKYGIAMGNGRDEVKESATHIAETVTNHGVKHILKRSSRNSKVSSLNKNNRKKTEITTSRVK